MELLQDHNEPLYLQLKKILRTAVVNGEYVPGQQIPTEQELMKQYNVSRITVRRAIQELINEKYLIKSQGKGTFVSQTRLSRELVKLKSFTEGCEEKSVEIAYATAEQAQLLGINKGAALFLMRTVVYDEEDCPVHHNIVYLDGVTYRFSF